MLYTGLPDGKWEVFLHKLPQLERIHYDLESGINERSADLFVQVFSRPLEGRPVCPQLQHLELPYRVLTQCSSATILKRALAERDVCGMRLKRIGLSGNATESEHTVALEPFLDLVDEVRWGFAKVSSRVPPRQRLLSVLTSLTIDST